MGRYCGLVYRNCRREELEEPGIRYGRVKEDFEDGHDFRANDHWWWWWSSCIFLKGLKEVTKILNKYSRLRAHKFVPKTPGTRTRNADLSSTTLDETGRYLWIHNGRRSALCGWARPAVNRVRKKRRCMSRSPHCLTQLFNSVYKTCSCFATVPYRRLSLELALEPCQKHAVPGGKTKNKTTILVTCQWIESNRYIDFDKVSLLMSSSSSFGKKKKQAYRVIILAVSAKTQVLYF
jgi:hypothetical protein